MDRLGKIMINIAGGIFGALLLGFTAMETFQFLNGVTDNPVVAVIGLVMFEGGFIYWGVVFKKSAEGLVQMAIALLTSLVDFGAVIVAVALSLGAVDKTVLGDKTASVVVVVAVLVNLSAKFFFSLTDPEVMQNIVKRASSGAAISETFRIFQSMVRDKAPLLANKMAENWFQDMERTFTEQHSIIPNQNLIAAGNSDVGLAQSIRNLFMGSSGQSGAVIVEAEMTARQNESSGHGDNESSGQKDEGERVPAFSEPLTSENTARLFDKSEKRSKDKPTVFTLDDVLASSGKPKEYLQKLIKLNGMSCEDTYKVMDMFGHLPEGMTYSDFSRFFDEFIREDGDDSVSPFPVE